MGLARRRAGDTIATAMGDVESLEWFYAHTVSQVAAGALACVTIDVVLLIQFGPAALVALVGQVLLIAIPFALLPLAARQGHRLRGALARLSADALAARRSARDTVLLGRVDAVGDAIADDTHRVQRARRALAVRMGGEQACSEAIAVSVTIFAVVFAARAAAMGDLDATLVPVAVILASASLTPASAIAGALARIGETSQAAQRWGNSSTHHPPGPSRRPTRL